MIIVLIVCVTLTINSSIWAAIFYNVRVTRLMISAGLVQKVLPGQPGVYWGVPEGEEGTQYRLLKAQQDLRQLNPGRGNEHNQTDSDLTT